MNRKEAIQIIGKHAPCPHYSAFAQIGMLLEQYDEEVN